MIGAHRLVPATSCLPAQAAREVAPGVLASDLEAAIDTAVSDACSAAGVGSLAQLMASQAAAPSAGDGGGGDPGGGGGDEAAPSSAARLRECAARLSRQLGLQATVHAAAHLVGEEARQPVLDAAMGLAGRRVGQAMAEWCRGGDFSAPDSGP